MSAAAIIWLVLRAVTLLIFAHDHGKPRTGKDSFWHALLACTLSVALLYWGGFFASVPK